MRKFSGVFSKGKLPTKMKDRGYIVNLDEYLETETFWIALNKYKNSLKIEWFFPNIYRIQSYDSMMFGYFCIALIEFLFSNNSNVLLIQPVALTKVYYNLQQCFHIKYFSKK